MWDCSHRLIFSPPTAWLSLSLPLPVSPLSTIIFQFSLTVQFLIPPLPPLQILILRNGRSPKIPQRPIIPNQIRKLTFIHLRNIFTRILNSYLLMLLLLVQARHNVTFLVWSLKPNVLNRWYASEGLRAYFLFVFQTPVVTICTARFNTQQFHVLSTQCIYVFCVVVRTNSDYFPI
jgi:hypothetical protein